MTSELTRERLQEIAEDGFLKHGESKELARMALAAMDSSESVELPLDYLQGHKDGLEWAAQLAEANHPETGDWLYDDPIELAKAIRKGPDMPPAQPVADSEPERNPVLGYADSYRDMAKQGVESVPIWSVITDLERNIAPLYRHAQPVPRVPDGYVMVPMRLTAENGAKGALSGEFSETKFVNCPECFGDEECETCDGSGRIEITVPVTWTTIKEIWAKGVEHFAAAPQSPGSEPATVPGKWIPVSERMPEMGEKQRYVLAADFKNNYWPNIPNTQVGVYGDWFDDGNPTWDDGDGEDLHLKEVTHWMPLPAGPKEDINALIPLVSRNEQEGK